MTKILSHKKKIAKRYIKEKQFAKIKGSICNIPNEVTSTYIFGFKRIDCSKIKTRSKVEGLCLFEPAYPNVIYQVLNYLKTHKKFCKGIVISEGLSSKEIINFSGTDEHRDVAENIHEKIISNETLHGSVQDLLSTHRTASNETALVSKIPYKINVESTIIVPGQGEKLVSILSGEISLSSS